jgi:hypothetical protein
MGWLPTSLAELVDTRLSLPQSVCPGWLQKAGHYPRPGAVWFTHDPLGVRLPSELILSGPVQLKCYPTPAEALRLLPGNIVQTSFLFGCRKPTPSFNPSVRILLWQSRAHCSNGNANKKGKYINIFQKYKRTCIHIYGSMAFDPAIQFFMKGGISL